MRILLIFLQTVAFLVLLATVLLILYLCAARTDFSESSYWLKNAIVFMFGNLFIDIFVFIAIAVLNIWFVLGPLTKIDDPVRRTVQHLSVIFIQTMIILAIGVFSFITMAWCGTAPPS